MDVVQTLRRHTVPDVGVYPTSSCTQVHLGQIPREHSAWILVLGCNSILCFSGAIMHRQNKHCKWAATLGNWWKNKVSWSLRYRDHRVIVITALLRSLCTEDQVGVIWGEDCLQFVDPRLYWSSCWPYTGHPISYDHNNYSTQTSIDICTRVLPII